MNASAVLPVGCASIVAIQNKTSGIDIILIGSQMPFKSMLIP
jgi:hypothetical protein